MDVLSDVLRVVRLSGAVFFTADFSSPWSLESPIPTMLASAVMPEADCVVLFHILVDGECEVVCEGHPVTTMASGDVIVFPRGDQHTMRTHGAATTTPLTSIFSPGGHDEPPQLSYGGGGRTSRFVCGYLNCDQRFRPLVEALPTMLLVRSDDDYSTIEAVDASGSRPTVVPQGSGTWLGTTLKFTINEARAARPGNAAMLGRLTELIFVEILREYMHRLPASPGRLARGTERRAGRQGVTPAAQESRSRLDRRRARTRGRGVALGVGTTVHGIGGRNADAIPRQLADAARQADDARRGAQHPGSRDTCRLRLRSCLQSRLQAGDGLAASDVAQERARRDLRHRRVSI